VDLTNFTCFEGVEILEMMNMCIGSG
jgi:hypothetical protein